MNKGTILGLGLLVVGIILWVGYGLYLGFEEIMEALDFISGSIALLILVGFAVIFISVFIEQQKDKSEFNKKIKKEDLEP
jgi:hypothetical protein